MKAKIKGLNRLYCESTISYESYRREAERLLRNLDWQKRIQFENLLLV